MENKKIISVLITCITILVIGLAVCLFFIFRNGSQQEIRPEPEMVNEQPTPLPITPTAEPTAEPVESVPITPTELPDEIFAEADDQIHILAEQVNLRAQPSEQAEIIGTAIQYKLVKRTGVSQHWSRLDYEGTICYVANQFVTTEPVQLADGDETIPATENSPELNQGSGHVVVIDPGHQARGDSAQEPIGPGASTTKPRVSSGTTGSVSGWAEYELNLAVSLQLRDALVSRGYTVYMTRETHEVSMSNKERAEFSTAKGGEILVRIHANGADNGSVNGALTMAPSASNPFLSADLSQRSRQLSQCIIDRYVAATGFANQGVYITDEMSGINWTTMPVTIVEMGYMTNAAEDTAMKDPAMQVQMVNGIANGIDDYFGY